MGLLQRLGIPDQRSETETDQAPERRPETDSSRAPAAPPPETQPARLAEERPPENGSVAGPGPALQDRHTTSPTPETAGAQVIAFANQKGGVAKTTTTLNLAVAFAEAGHRVLAVDMDPQGNLTMSQGIDPDSLEKSMYDVLVHHISIREVIRKREVDVACASIDLAGAEIAMSTQIGRERSLQKALRPVMEDYDFVCIDTPPSLGLLTINALTAANKVIVPVQCEYLSMRGLVQLQNTLSMIRQELNPDVHIEGILPTLVDTRTVHAKEAIEILEENFGDRVFATRIKKTIRFAEAPVKGTSVLKYDPDGVAAESYRELAKEVLGNGKR
jgi:chromosome partitioning protein